MSNVIKMGTDTDSSMVPPMPKLLKREEIAAQMIAVAQASFSRPGREEMLEILKCATQQAQVL